MIPHPFKKKKRRTENRPSDLARTETHVGVSLSEARRESRITYPFVCVCKSIGNGVEMNGEGEESGKKARVNTRKMLHNFHFYSYVRATQYLRVNSLFYFSLECIFLRTILHNFVVFFFLQFLQFPASNSSRYSYIFRSPRK